MMRHDALAMALSATVLVCPMGCPRRVVHYGFAEQGVMPRVKIEIARAAPRWSAANMTGNSEMSPICCGPFAVRPEMLFLLAQFQRGPDRNRHLPALMYCPARDNS